jgi:hypothetical protein
MSISKSNHSIDSLKNTYESLDGTSSDKTPAVDKQSKSASPPIMKTRTAIFIQEELNTAVISSTNTQSNHDIRRDNTNEIATPQQPTEVKAQWVKFTEKINPDGVLTLEGLNSEDIQDLAQWLNKQPSTKLTGLKLQCDQNAFSTLDCKASKALAKVIQTTTSITMLDLGCNRIGDENMKVITEALKINKSIKMLNLSSTFIGNESAKALAEMLMTNSTITTLDLTANGIGDEGRKALAKTLASNTTITNLDLLFNQVEDYKTMDLFEIIMQQCTLNSQRAQIENNIAAALDLLTDHPNLLDGNMTSIPDVNNLIAEKIFVIDKAEKLNTEKVIKDPNIVFKKYT